MALKLPETVTVDFQPYGKFTLGQLKEGSYNGFPTIEGVVISGTEVGALLGGRPIGKPRDISGRKETIYGIKQWELDAGHIVRVAM